MRWRRGNTGEMRERGNTGEMRERGRRMGRGMRQGEGVLMDGGGEEGKRQAN